MHARIFTKIFLVVSNYLMNLSLKFRKDPCFRWGDIQLLVTMYIWYYTLNYSQFLTENFDFFGTPSWKCFYIFSARYLSLKERKRIRAFLWKNEPRRTSALHMIWWHSANRDVLPGRFQPYMEENEMFMQCLMMGISVVKGKGIWNNRKNEKNMEKIVLRK